MENQQSFSCYEAIIRHYQQYRKDNPDHHIDNCLAQPKLSAAIVAAAEAVDAKGKIHSHQRRIGRERLERWAGELKNHERAINASKSFDELHAVVESAANGFAEGGIGELTVYDTAHRIGAKKGMLPDKIYLHSGTRRGALIFTDHANARPYIEINLLPKPFHQLDATAIEDILCIYKDHLKRCQNGNAPFPPSSALRPVC